MLLEKVDIIDFPPAKSRPEGRLLAFRRAGGEMESIWTKAAGRDAKINIMI